MPARPATRRRDLLVRAADRTRRSRVALSSGGRSRFHRTAHVGVHGVLQGRRPAGRASLRRSRSADRLFDPRSCRRLEPCSPSRPRSQRQEDLCAFHGDRRPRPRSARRRPNGRRELRPERARTRSVSSCRFLSGDWLRSAWKPLRSNVLPYSEPMAPRVVDESTRITGNPRKRRPVQGTSKALSIAMYSSGRNASPLAPLAI